jgi:tripartite-type tricarboxylate transporter receptor subunit TctC
MSLHRRHALALLAAVTAMPVRAQALGQTRILYGFPAGSAGDAAARQVAARLASSRYTQAAPWVENKVGAGGRIALEALKASPADGATLVLTPMSTLAIYPHVYRRLGYDPVRDLAPVGTAALTHHGLAIGPAVPPEVADLRSLATWARANPKLASYGSPGAGSTPHFLGALLGQAQGFDWQHVPYRGAVPGINDVVAGQVAAMLAPTGDFMSFHRAGKLRVLATSGASRLPFAPDVPTLGEQGQPELTVEEWFAFYARAGSPQAVVEAASQAIRSALAAPALGTALGAVGLLPLASSQQQLVALQRVAFERWGPLVRRVGFTADS